MSKPMGAQRVKSYPGGFALDQLGTFPTPGVAGCPVRHPVPAAH